MTAGDEKAEVSPSDAGLSVDYAASVELAGGGRSLDPRHIWRVLTGGSRTDVVVVTDRAELDAAVAELAKNVDREPKDARLASTVRSCRPKTRTGSLWTPRTRPRPSRKVPEPGGPVPLPAEVTEPEITTAEVASWRPGTPSLPCLVR